MSNLLTRLYSSGSYLCEIAQKLFSRPSFNSTKKCQKPINEVLIYGDNDKGKSRQMGLSNLFCVYYVIMHANRSVDICVPSLVNAALIKCLLGVHRNYRVKIRIVVHHCKHLKSLMAFTKNGIQVKAIYPPERLEHDFILIDATDSDAALAVLGFVDYGTTRVSSHREATVLTSQANVVKALKQEFERVWLSADGEVGNERGEAQVHH